MSRISNFLEALERERLDAFLVTSQVDIRYLVGFSGSAGMLWVSKAFEKAFSIMFLSSRVVPAMSKVTNSIVYF